MAKACGAALVSAHTDMDVDEITAWGVGSLQYADPVLDKLDIHHVVHHRLFRESCHFFKGNYVKVCMHGARRVRCVAQGLRAHPVVARS